MTDVQFRNLNSEEQVSLVNQRLIEGSGRIADVATEIGVPASSLSNLLTKAGYAYSRKLKQYVIKADKERQVEEEPTKLLEYLIKNEDILRRVIEDYKGATLVLNPIVYKPNVEQVTKSFKLNIEVYNEFHQLLANKYPHYRIQDAIAQALLDFVENYK
ncbi:hypothetical protein [Lysinibacillus sphaericus]|uniref:hypothetical protein n=1 Tax=Lysinibacillus sphaericus TaxID=1421 RepID=UPI003D702B70